jgi:hypothetical protein
MKTLIFTGMALLCLTPALKAQNASPYPCLKTLAVKNLGNNQSCSAMSGYQKTGLVVVSFTSAIPTAVNAPEITSLFNTDGNGNPTTQIDAKFVFKNFGSTRQSAEYCYYTPTGQNLLSNGSQVFYKATITYPSYDPASCDVQNIDPPSSLPVSFLYFTAGKNSGGVSLKWATSTEINNKGFWIQRKTGAQWEDVFFIPTAAPDGNSNGQLNYSYLHKTSAKGLQQYRLQQVDIDGQTKYSEVRTVKEDGNTTEALLFPNPSKGSNISVVLPDPQLSYQIQVLDVNGRTVHQTQNVRNVHTLQLLNKGQFFVRITDTKAGTALTERLIVQ